MKYAQEIVHTYRACQKVISQGKFYTSGISANTFTKFAKFTDECSPHIPQILLKITNTVQQIQQFKL